MDGSICYEPTTGRSIWFLHFLDIVLNFFPLDEPYVCTPPHAQTHCFCGQATKQSAFDKLWKVTSQQFCQFWKDIKGQKKV